MHNGESGQSVYDFSRITDTGPSTAAVNAVQTWRLNNDTDAGGLSVGDYATYETSASPPASSTIMKKRGYIRISSPSPIPDDPGDANDPDSLTFYIARGTAPLITSYCRVAPLTGVNKTVTSVLLDTLPTTVAPPPNPVGNFPTAGVTPAVIKSSAGGGAPNWQFKGDGAWTLTPLGSHDPSVAAPLTAKYDTGWQEIAAATGFTKVVARWRRIGAMVCLQVQVTNNASIAIAANGSITNTVITAALPTEILPPFIVYGGLAFGTSGSGATGYVQASNGQCGISSADGTGTARNLAAASPIFGMFTWMV
jgi:hypothetical protein